jgi:hypothetical protein
VGGNARPEGGAFPGRGPERQGGEAYPRRGEGDAREVGEGPKATSGGRGQAKLRQIA